MGFNETRIGNGCEGRSRNIAGLPVTWNANECAPPNDANVVKRTLFTFGLLETSTASLGNAVQP